ncbi:MAG: DUF488 domain-containing protein [Geminicoccaceae bacterium]
MAIDVKRAYEARAKSDGCRILVDRIWPRGLTKDDLRVDAWFKDLAPSTALRKWFGHDPKKWDEFRQRYAEELEQRSGALAELIARVEAGHVTLVFGAKDSEHNNAVALKQQLERRLAR